MHISNAVGRLMTGRWRLTIAMLGAVVCASAAFALGTPPSASAAGPVILPSGSTTMFPTWSGSPTTVCSRNRSYMYGQVDVSPFPYWFVDRIYTSPWGERCITRSWYGNPIKLTNRGRGEEIVRSF